MVIVSLREGKEEGVVLVYNVDFFYYVVKFFRGI